VRGAIKTLQESGYGHYPVCVAKTQYSFSTDPKLRGAPSGHVVNIREVRLAAGAEFIVMICGDIMTMIARGLPSTWTPTATWWACSRAIEPRSGRARGDRSKSIDYVARDERHGRVIDQVPFWFLGNFHFFTIAIGFVGPTMGLGWGYTALAGALGILFGTIFVAFHASQGVELSASYNITYAPSVSDYSRYLPYDTRPRDIIAAVFTGAASSAIWLIALGAWLAAHLGASDGLVALHDAGDSLMPGFGTLLAIASVIALVATMGLNAYSGMLTIVTGLSSFIELRTTARLRVMAIVVLALAWLAISFIVTGDAIELVYAVLTMMLYLLVPWTAVNLVDYFFVRRGRYAITQLFTPHGIYGAWSLRGLAAYGIGFVSTMPFFVLPDYYVGPAARALDGVDVGWLVGLIVSATVYLWLSRSFDARSEAAAVAESDAELGIRTR
jgi:purine-cytosine permease-like protein